MCVFAAPCETCRGSSSTFWGIRPHGGMRSGFGVLEVGGGGGRGPGPVEGGGGGRSLLPGHGTFSTSKVGGWWRLVAVGGGWRLVAVGGGWWQLVAVGGGWWRLVAVGGWRLAVGGPLGLYFRAVLHKKKKM